MKMTMQKSNLTTKEITLFQAIPYFSWASGSSVIVGGSQPLPAQQGCNFGI